MSWKNDINESVKSQTTNSPLVCVEHNQHESWSFSENMDQTEHTVIDQQHNGHGEKWTAQGCFSISNQCGYDLKIKEVWAGTN